MKIKPGASIDKCSADILRGAIAVEPLFISRGIDLIVTSGSEVYEHSVKYSAHYRGDALDVRSKTLGTTKRKTALLVAMRRKLGPGYTVLLESINKPWEHYHIHWSPVFETF